MRSRPVRSIPLGMDFAMVGGATGISSISWLRQHHSLVGKR